MYVSECIYPNKKEHKLIDLMQGSIYNIKDDCNETFENLINCQEII
jgi:hypothetical protein